MQDTAPEKIIPADDKISPAAVPTRLKISPPRSPWIEFALSFSTFGVYTGIWMVMRMREFKQLTQFPVTPWLWFFSVHSGFVQLFALPRFFKVLRQVEFRQNITVTERWPIWWMIVTVLVSLGSNAVTRQDELPVWMDISILFFWSLLFSFLQIPINRLKESMTDIEFTPRKTVQTVIECLIAIPLFCLILWLLFNSVIKPHMIDKIEKFHHGEVYYNSDLGLDLEFHSAGWTQVAIGTFTSEDDLEDVIAEFESPIKGNFYIIWNQGTDADSTRISRYRQNEFLTDYPDGNCRQVKKFANSSQDINVYTSCAKSDFLTYHNQYSTLIKSKGVYYELAGYFHSSKSEYESYIKAIKKMANEFEAVQ